MKPKLCFALCLFGMLLFGCGGGTRTVSVEESVELLPEPYSIAFDVNNLSSKDAPVMSDMVDSLEYIKLEFHPDYPIGFIVARPHIDNEYIVLGASHGTGLLQYTRQGKFVRRIGSIGRGPGEYLQIRGFWVDREAGIIYTLPNYEQAVDRYDFATGKYLGETPITEADGKPLIKDDHNTLFPLSGSIMVTEAVGAVTFRQIPPFYAFRAIDLSTARMVHREESKMYPSSGRATVGSSYIWYDPNGRLNLKEDINNTAYMVHPDFTTTPKASFDLGDAMIDAQSFQTIHSAESAQSKLFVNAVLEANRYILMRLQYAGNHYSVSFDKSSGESRLSGKMSMDEYEERGQFLGFHNDLDGGLALSPLLYNSYDKDIWYTSYDAYRMMELLTPEHFATVRSTVKYPDRLAQLQTFTASLTENDNPVIVIAHLKPQRTNP